MLLQEEVGSGSRCAPSGLDRQPQYKFTSRGPVVACGCGICSFRHQAIEVRRWLEKLSPRLDAVVLVAATEDEFKDFESYLWLSRG